MKSNQGTANVTTAFGEDLGDKSFTHDFEWTSFESYAEIPANELPSNVEVLKMVNAKRKASAQSSARSAEFTKRGIKAPTLEDPDVQFKTIVKALVASGKSQAVAEQIARANLG
jgi:hypothetical protein